MPQDLIKHIKYILFPKSSSLIYQLKAQFLISLLVVLLWASCCQNIVGFLVFCMCFCDLTQTTVSSMWNSVLWQSVCCFAKLVNLLANYYCGKRDKDRGKQLQAAFV